MLLSQIEEKNFKRYLARTRQFRALISYYLFPVKLAIYNLKKGGKATISNSTTSTTKVDGLDYNSIKDNCKKYYIDLSLLPSQADKIRLAGNKTVEIENINLNTGDIQDTHAYNRLYWILDSNIEQKKEILKKWLSSEFVQHPYDSSERIITLIWFLSYHTNLEKELEESCINRLYLDVEYLKNNIEHHLGIHNHVINNCRALVAASNVLNTSDIKQAADDARKMMTDYWDKLILDDGFFNEQSTSYHVLLTRTFLEYYYDAEINHIKLPDSLLSKGKKMCTITNKLFNPNGTLALIGDITPDFPTPSFKGLTHACYNSGLLDDSPTEKEKGFALGVANLFIEKRVESDSKNEQVQFYPDSGLLIVKQKDIKLIAFCPRQSRILGHGDAGSIGGYELYLKGEAVIVDGGLKEYTANTQLIKAKSASNNNTISINGIDVAVNTNDQNRLPEGYVNSPENEINKTKNAISFKSHGFKRTDPSSIWERIFDWSNDKLTVTDKVTASKKVKINNYIHQIGESILDLSDNVSFETTDIAREYGDTIKGNRLINSATTNNYNFKATFANQ